MEKTRIDFLAGAKYKDKIYFSSIHWNGFFSYDLKTEETQFLCVFEREQIKYMLFNRAFLCGNEMWLIPARASHIVCVNLDTLDVFYLSIPWENGSPFPRFFYYDTVRSGDKLYIIPYFTDNILEVDMPNHKCDVIYQSEILKSFWASGAFIINDTLCVVKHDGDIGLRIDLNDYRVLELNKDVGSSICHYSTYLNGVCWHMAHESKLLYKSDVTNDGKLMRRESVECDQKPFYRGVSVGNSILFFPCGNSKTFMKIEPGINRREMIDGLFDGFEETVTWFEMTVLDSDEGVWITGNNGVAFDISDPDNIKRFCIYLSNEQADRFFEKEYETGIIDEFSSMEVFHENPSFVTLDQYLKYINMR